jgi:ribosomal protein L30/L7E
LVTILQICLINSKIDQTRFHSTILNHLRLKNQSAFSKLN